MADARDEAVELGRWLREQRTSRRLGARELSGKKFAEFFNLYIRKKGLPVKEVHQQEISSLEKLVTAPADKGPKRRQPWWQALREFVESGELDTILHSNNTPREPPKGAVVIEHDFIPRSGGRTAVTTPDGKVVGYVDWKPPKSENL